MPEAIPLEVVFEDEDLLVINKPAGMVVHPAPGHHSGTLVHALLGRGGSWSSAGGAARPGIVHRLDKGTSGLIVVARNDASHRALSSQLSDRPWTFQDRRRGAGRRDRSPSERPQANGRRRRRTICAHALRSRRKTQHAYTPAL